ncbi:AAA family ATPase [Actinomadura madurae]|uniref:MinD/ParA family ATP-binding protein n=1 Tax=Actinomadura madurae TaxID=1993 RepID=UPI0020D20846|nr:MinD/ParA family protein [Actinomadura madurae]MCP9952030.1 AAA family ATPase [Actinomadura madurae]MCP9968789.1 AAA family ATPase [Actinomadura madurae]
MARNEHDGRSLEERLASLDAMSGDTTGPSPVPEAEKAPEENTGEQENAPPPAEPAAEQAEQTDPNSSPWLAAPPTFQGQPGDDAFGPPMPPPYDGGPMPQPFDGGMLPPPYAGMGGGYQGYEQGRPGQQPSPYEANGNATPPLDQLPPYPSEQAPPQDAAGQPYQPPVDPATGQPYPQDTDASGQPYVPIDPNTGRPMPPDPNAQPFPPADPAAAGRRFTPMEQQPFPSVDPVTGQPWQPDPNAGAQPYPPADPSTGQMYQQDPGAVPQPYPPMDPNMGRPYPPPPPPGAQPYPPVDPNTGQPYPPVDPNTGQSYPPVDPNTGQPYAPVDPATGQPYAPVDPATGQPYPPVDPNTGQPYPAVDPNTGQPYAPVDPNTGQPYPQPGYGYPGGPPQDPSQYPQALNQMMQPDQSVQQQPSGPQSTDNLSSENLLGERRIAPSSGWRRAVYKATAGNIHPGESQNDLRRKDLVARARTPVTGGHHRVAVMSLKGGVGKTTTTTGLGSMLGSLRGDRVIAVDANPDRGTLSDKVRLETAATVRDLLNNREQIHRYADVRAFTSQNEARLEILASDRDPAVSEAFSADDYAAVAVVLEQYYSVCITDCGTGLLHSAMAGVLSLADQLVLVSSPSVDGARSASATLDWLEAHDHGHLVRNGVVVLSMVRNRTRSQVDLDKLQSHFESRCRAVVRIPYDDHLEEGAEVELEQLAPGTREAYLTLAAVVGDGFAYQRPQT